MVFSAIREGSVVSNRVQREDFRKFIANEESVEVHMNTRELWGNLVYFIVTHHTLRPLRVTSIKCLLAMLLENQT